MPVSGYDLVSIPGQAETEVSDGLSIFGKLKYRLLTIGII